MYDLIIVGSGPSGATLARLAGKNYKILLLDKRNFNGETENTVEKCCGGLLAPDAQQMLAQFGLGVPKSVLLGPQLFGVRTIDITNSIERYYQRHYINIDREKFDEWLVSLIPSSVDIGENCIFKGFEEKDDGISVKFFHDGKEYVEKAKALIGADGAHSIVRKQALGDLEKSNMYISVQEWFENKNNEAFYGAIFDEEITDFYSWTIPKEDQLILGTAVRLEDNPSEKIEILKNKLSKYGFQFNNLIKRRGAHILRPRSTKDISEGKGIITFIGEAGGFISPSSAEGLSYAFRSALALAESLEDGTDGYLKRYKSRIKSLKNNIFLKNLKTPAMYNPQIRNLIMKTGLMSFNIYNA